MLTIRNLNSSDLDGIKKWFEMDPGFPGDFSPFDWDITRTSFLSKMKNTLSNENAKIRFYSILHEAKLLGLLLSIQPVNFDYFEIGFYILPAERGKGYGSEALRQFIDFLFGKHSHISRIEAGTSSLNVPSQKLLEKMCFVKEGIRHKTLFRKGRWEDSFLYALVRE